MLLEYLCFLQINSFALNIINLVFLIMFLILAKFKIITDRWKVAFPFFASVYLGEVATYQGFCYISLVICIFFLLWYFRNNAVAQEIVEQIQKLLNTRAQQKTKSPGNGQEYVCVGEEHLRRRDFKKAVICFSLVITNNLKYKYHNNIIKYNNKNYYSGTTNKPSY